MANIKVSILTVVFNNVINIEQCIKSVLGQTYKNLEYIVIDGKSSDGTLDVIKKYEHGISKWISEPDHGVYDAINKGIRMATGDVIGILHSDDFYASDKVIEKMAEAFTRYDVQSVYGDLVYVSKDGSRLIRYWRAGEYQEGMIKWGWMPPHPTFFVKKEVYQKYGCFNTSLRIAADYEMVLRLLAKQKITTCYIPEVLIKMRVGGISNGSIKGLVRKTVEDYRALRINGLNLAILTVLSKNLSKIPQFFMR